MQQASTRRSGRADERRGAIDLVIVGLWLGEHLADGLLDQLLDAAAGWVRSHRPRKLPMEIRILYGPDGEIARSVKIPPTDD